MIILSCLNKENCAYRHELRELQHKGLSVLVRHITFLFNYSWSETMRLILISPVLLILGFCAILSAGCSSLLPRMQDPEVKLVGLHLLPAEGLQQRLAVDLLISNPNTKDLSVRGISYKIGIENISLLSGLTDKLLLLKSYQETPVTLEVSADLLQLLRLAEHFGRNGIGENVNYHFSAVIDFSAWLPSLHVDKKGALPLVQN
jgi:LEA14-like dessication related protein